MFIRASAATASTTTPSFVSPSAHYMSLVQTFNSHTPQLLDIKVSTVILDTISTYLQNWRVLAWYGQMELLVVRPVYESPSVYDTVVGMWRAKIEANQPNELVNEERTRVTKDFCRRTRQLANCRIRFVTCVQVMCSDTARIAFRSHPVTLAAIA
jgi:hypothetical protein